MRSDAGYRRSDGSRDDLTGHQAWLRCRTSKPAEETGAHCPYALPTATVKDGKEWDAQTLTWYKCYLYRNWQQPCRSDKPMCHEMTMIKLMPMSAAAHHAATGLPSS